MTFIILHCYYVQSYTGSEELTLRLTMSRREELTGAELEEALAAQQAATAAATEGVAQEMQVDGGAGEDEEAEAAAAASTSTAAAAAAAASGDSGMPPPPPPPPPLLPHLHTPGAASASRPFSSGRQQPGGGAYTPGGGGYFFSHHADQPMRSSSDVIGRAGGREGGGGGAAGHSPHPNLLSRGGSLAASLASPAASGAGVAAGSASSSSSAVLRKHFVEGFVEMPDAVAPMFPDEGEPDPGSWDEYGEKLPAAVMAAAATAAAAAAAADAAAMADKLMQQQDVGVGGQASKQEEEMEEEPPQKPTKVVDYDVTLTIRAAMRFVDFDGRTDGASLRRIISRVAPRQLVLVHGTQPALVTLKHACQQDLASLGTQICLPSAYETVPLALAPTARVLLSATLLDSLAVSQQGEVKLGWLNGVLQPQKPDRLPAGRAGPLQLVPVLGAAANGNGGGGGADGAHQQQHHGGIFLGDVKLSDLKAELAKAGLAAEFQAGSLLCGPVTVSRSAGQDGRLVVQGALCDEFFRIRDLIYKQYHVC